MILKLCPPAYIVLILVTVPNYYLYKLFQKIPDPKLVHSAVQTCLQNV